MEYTYPDPRWSAGGSTSHAHPKLEASTPTTTQSLCELLANVKVEIELRGLPGADRYKATDVYCPEVRRSPTISDHHVSHLDVVSCWKGLSIKYASEIVWWEVLFQEALERMVLSTVLRSFAEHVRESPDLIDETTVIPSLIQFTTAKTSRLIDIDVAKLVNDMMHSHYEAAFKAPSAWFVLSRDLSSMVYNFVRTRDCFLDSYPFPCLEISFSHDHDRSRLLLMGEVNWQPPVINFDNLPVELPAGAEYRITPHFQDLDLGSSLGPRFTSFFAEPTFHTSSKTLPLAWDGNLLAFRAIVPSDKPRSTLKARERDMLLDRTHGSNRHSPDVTTFSATIVRTFPENVRFEQTTRYTLKLDVRYPPNPTPTVPDQSPVSKLGIHYIVPPPSPFNDEKSHCEETVDVFLSPPILDENDTNTPRRESSWLPSYSNTPLSKCGHHSPERVPWYQEEKSSCATLLQLPDHDKSLESRNTSLWSFANTDELKSQVNHLEQNRPPQQAYTQDLKIPRETGYDAESDITMGSDEIAPTDTRQSPDIRPSILSTQVQSYDAMKSDWDQPAQQELTQPASREGIENITPEICSNQRPFDTVQDNFRSHRSPSVSPASARFHECYSPQKRKATKQVPKSIMFENPSVFTSQRLALDKFQHMDLELAAKRQRLDSRVDSGAWESGLDLEMVDADTWSRWDDEEAVSGMNIRTGRLGEASGTSPPTEGQRGWLERLNGLDRGMAIALAPARSNALDGLPRLRKNKSLKRVVVHRRGGGPKAPRCEESVSPPTSLGDSVPVPVNKMPYLVEQRGSVFAESIQPGSQHDNGSSEGLGRSQRTRSAEREMINTQPANPRRSARGTTPNALFNVKAGNPRVDTTFLAATQGAEPKGPPHTHVHDKMMSGGLNNNFGTPYTVGSGRMFRPRPDSRNKEAPPISPIYEPETPKTPSQDEIQRNYSEFQEKGGVGKDIEDLRAKAESKVFESIFLMEDSQEEGGWESESTVPTVTGDGSGEEMGREEMGREEMGREEMGKEERKEMQEVVMADE
ncbi:hypothetical protein P154DRAFT_349590 [Amniculicola lignicola CBS 123094]|uniref:Uncharacterized protein n=1 Tax=Amniculicola lignicola CBS 123094 TaxID=1392246 RepID=A0A6A5W1Q1_9PLEO|nr:hypothetical protein P154DRAFT_349590 [Amniculicola lignicola CBS 123094]